MMQTTEKTVRARNTVIPALGFGTYELTGSDCREMVRVALEAGYRHIDTAQVYDNEEQVGAGIKDAGTDRESFFLTTKVWFDNYEPAKLETSVENSLRKLKTDYVEQKEKGRTKAVGISNFTLSQLEKACEITGQNLVTNQVEYHPFLDQSKMLDRLAQKEMALTAYSPLARGKIFEDETVTEIARQHGVDAAQITLAWLLGQPGVVAIPKSSSREHALSNFKGAEIELSAEERAAIDKLGSPEGRLIDPSFAPDWD